eukprot:290603-Rhodomonas_salina.1
MAKCSRFSCVWHPARYQYHPPVHQHRPPQIKAVGTMCVAAFGARFELRLRVWAGFGVDSYLESGLAGEELEEDAADAPEVTG